MENEDFPLTQERVIGVFETCLLNPRDINRHLGDPNYSFIEVRHRGVTSDTVTHLNNEKIEANKAKIVSMLNTLHKNFWDSTGGSVSDGCFDSNGRKWTKDVLVFEKLIILATALGYVNPRREYTSPNSSITWVATREVTLGEIRYVFIEPRPEP